MANITLDVPMWYINLTKYQFKTTSLKHLIMYSKLKFQGYHPNALLNLTGI